MGEILMRISVGIGLGWALTSLLLLQGCGGGGSHSRSSGVNSSSSSASSSSSSTSSTSSSGGVVSAAETHLGAELVSPDSDLASRFALQTSDLSPENSQDSMALSLGDLPQLN